MLYAPTTLFANNTVYRAASWLDISQSCLRGFSTYEELSDAYLSDETLRRSVQAAVNVSDPSSMGGPNILASYTILVSDPPTGQSTGPLKSSRHVVWSGGEGGNTTKWEDSGLLGLQWGLDRGIADAYAPGLGEAMLSMGGRSLHTQRLPTAALKSNFNPESEFPKYILSVYLVMGILFSFTMMVNTLVGEKEAKLFEGLQVMGLSEFASFFGWWLFYIPLHTFSATVVTVITSLSGFLASSNILLLWITLECFVFAYVAYAMLFVAYFQTAKSAQFVAFLTIISSVTLSIVLALNDFEPKALSWVLCVASPLFAAPTAAFQFFIQEYSGRGLTLSSWGETPLPIYRIWLVLIFDVFLYFGLAKYLSLVLSKRRPWHFIFVPSSWFTDSNESPGSPRHSISASGSGSSRLGGLPERQLEGQTLEEGEVVTVAVRANSLKKTFTGEGGNEVQVGKGPLIKRVPWVLGHVAGERARALRVPNFSYRTRGVLHSSRSVHNWATRLKPAPTRFGYRTSEPPVY